MRKHRQCCVTTKRGIPCPHYADRTHDGLDYCHVHDPQGTYQMQNRGLLPRHNRAETTPTPPKRKSKVAQDCNIVYAPGGSWEQRIADGTSYPDPHTVPPFIPTRNVYRCEPTLQ